MTMAMSRTPVPQTMAIAKFTLGQAQRNGTDLHWPTNGCYKQLKPLCTETLKHGFLLSGNLKPPLQRPPAEIS